MAVRGLRHLSLKTRCLDDTIKFYTEVLGLEVAFRVPPKRVFLCWRGQDDLLDFVKTTGTVNADQGLDHFGFRVPRASLRQIEQSLKKNKVRIIGRRGERAFTCVIPTVTAWNSTATD
jgi:catechol 2,3-dioxygenase-like lactoylglutathione lyase family enzyme